MTNYERVINRIAQLGKVSIRSNNNILNNIIIDIDTYDIYMDCIVIGSLNGSELTIHQDDVVKMDGNVVYLKEYTLVFD